MKLLYTYLLSVLFSSPSLALPPNAELVSPGPHSALHKRGRDCGTFKFKCKNSAGACNNACYFINCVNGGDRKFTFGSSPVDNRVHSGCTTTQSSSLCRLSPISQRSWDRNPNAAKPLQCDEFPMNVFKQAAFQAGKVRNSLRCINGPENGSGGSQFSQFIHAQGDWKPGGDLAKDRKCDGDMKDGDTFEVDWIIDGDNGVSDKDKFVPYCKPKPDCANDGYQFHMTKLQIPDKRTKGSFSKPYNPLTDNHYALTSKSDILQYRVKIHRIEEYEFDCQVYEVQGSGEVWKAGKKGTMKVGGQIKIDGLPADKSLLIFSRGAPGTVVDFTYAGKDIKTSLDVSFPNGDYVWSTDDSGVAGKYCQVGEVNQVGNAEQWIQCDFPAMAG